MRYAIEATYGLTTKYVQAEGTLGDDPVEQTAAVWGASITVTGLPDQVIAGAVDEVDRERLDPAIVHFCRLQEPNKMILSSLLGAYNVVRAWRIDTNRSLAA